MKIASNKIKDVIKFFHEELSVIYEKEEIETFITFCFEEFLNIKRIDLKSLENETMSESQLLKFNFAVKDLKKEKPIQYILGKADFYGMKFIVNEHVLIPRPETEELVHLVISENKDRKVNILDIGTGSGCIAIALKKKLPDANVTAIDISEKALATAKQNALLNKTELHFILANILNMQSLINNLQFNIIVSNPPYIKISEKGTMKKNVLEYEPHLALFVNDNDPFLFYKAIADFALKGLKTGGVLYFEINEAYGAECADLLVNKGFKDVSLGKDLSNKNRILRGIL